MTLVTTTRARAYINWGRWVAGCPREHCTSAEALTPRQGLFHCSNCRMVAEVEWPSDADGIWQVLQARPVPSTRNWFPSGHELAIRSGCPHGQTVADLEDESREHGVSPTGVGGGSH